MSEEQLRHILFCLYLSSIVGSLPRSPHAATKLPIILVRLFSQISSSTMLLKEAKEPVSIGMGIGQVSCSDSSGDLQAGLRAVTKWLFGAIAH